jgi:hypothetical protein
LTWFSQRNEAKSTFIHILNNVLDCGNGDPLKSSLVGKGIDDIFSFMNLDENTVDGLKYKYQADGNTLKPIRLSNKMILKCFLHFGTNKELEKLQTMVAIQLLKKSLMSLH